MTAISKAALLCAFFALPNALALQTSNPSSSDSGGNPTQCNDHSANAVRNVAIIGAGAAGASTAYHLMRFSGAAPTNITIFERNDYVGGRTTTVNAFDNPDEAIELGGSIFVDANAILMNATKAFNLSTAGDSADAITDAKYSVGTWDGSSFRFLLPAKTSFADVPSFLWKYGVAYWRTTSLTKSIVSDFLKLYEAPHFPFYSLGSEAGKVGLADPLSVYGKDLLAKHGISEDFATDLIQAATRANYAQNLDQLHGVETMVSMATDGASAVYGGNWQIFASMVRASAANLRLDTTVTSITRNADGKFVLKSRDTGAVPRMSSQTDGTLYDAVIIAAPYQYAGLTISPQLAVTPHKIDYVSLHVTLFTSPHKVSPAYFGSGTEVPLQILTTLPGKATGGPAPFPFSSITRLRRVFNPRTYPARAEFAYKIFSAQPLNASFVSTLMGIPLPENVAPGQPMSRLVKPEGDISWSHEKTWNSYPYLPPRDSFDGPALGKNVWYTSGIESFISTMETSALSGMNVAQLMVNEWKQEARDCESAADQAVPYDSHQGQGLLGSITKTEL